MKMIIGGYAQGKTEYARKNYNAADSHIFRLNAEAERMLREGLDPSEELRAAVKKDPELIVITEETGRGVVPLEAAQRDFREKIGRLQIEAAEMADEVVHVVCGIGRRIK